MKKQINYTQLKMSMVMLLLCITCWQTQAQIITTVAGNGTSGYSGDGGPATSAELNGEWGAAMFYEGYLYIADQFNNRIRKVDPFTGIITTIAGNDTLGYSGDGGPASSAKIYYPSYIAFDNNSNLYFNDYGNSAVRKISTSGIITTVAGGTYSGLGSGDGGPATAAGFGNLNGLCIDGSNNIYVGDRVDAKVRKVDATTGIITTVAGNGFGGFAGDGGDATAAQLDIPSGMCVDAAGNLYIADLGNYRIRMVNTSGTISTFAGTGFPAYSGDGGPASAAQLFGPEDITIDALGNFFITEDLSNTVRKINTSGIISTVAGNYALGAGYGGDGGAATAAQMNYPVNTTLDCAGNLYISDIANSRVRMVNYFSNHAPHFTNGASWNVNVCVSSGANPISSLLAVSDTDTGQNEWWVIYANPSHGTLGGFVYSTTSTGGIITPAGLTYTPTTGYTGNDTFSIGITDCAGGTSVITIYVIVNPLPAPITGTTTLCVGGTTTLSDATSGGIWSFGSSFAATVGSSSGIVSGVAGGTAVITYTAPSGCFTTTTVTVTALPAITGTTFVCSGATTTLSDTYGGGTWTSTSTGVATIGSSSGVVTGVSSGTSTISYSLPTGCYITTTVTVSGAAPITGTFGICIGATTTLSDATTGGTWSSGTPAVATIDSTTGLVTGISAGTSTITYRLATGCFVTATFTVIASPAPITGVTAICTGHTTTLSDATGGGHWSSSNTAIVTIGSSTGIVTTVSLGTAIITYSVSTGCYVTTTVAPLPPISGLHNMCAYSDSLMAVDVPGGLYSSAGVTVTNLGGGNALVVANAAGIDTITYILSTGCSTTSLLTVNPLPGLITGTDRVCVGSTTTLSDAATGGTWTSGSTGIATVGSATGIVTGVSHGTAVITYTLPTGCFADTPVVVNPAPTAIGGGTYVCTGSTITLTDGLPGGTWSSNHISIATVGSATGIVMGISPGIDTITYTLCTNSVNIVITVSALAPIMGANTLCVGSTTTLSDATSGGVWASSNTGVATVGSSSGVVTAVAAGTVTIHYTLSAGCSLSFVITVNTTTVDCTPCTVFGAYSPLGTSGHITSNVGAGNYYIANNVTVTGTDTFTNAIIMIAPYDTVFIDTSAVLTLDSTHMFSLCTEWQGMELKPGRTHSGRLFVTHSSLIEDAMCAVYIPNAVTPSSGLIFKSEASIFNRNAVGVFIQHFTPSTPIYPFVVHNTVITSRDFQTTNPHFPDQWPPVLGIGGLKNYYATDTFSAPYNINTYAGVRCYGSILPTNGIRLDSVGMSIPDTTYFTGVGIPARYDEIVIGDTTTTSGNVNQNLFDNLHYGIYAINSNITCLNNAFTYMFAIIPEILPSGLVESPGGDGIYVGETDDVANENRLRVYTPPGSRYKNLFYDFNLGVECSNYFQVISDSTYMINKSFATSGSPASGTGGYYIKTAKYDTIDISGNTISNVLTGVAVWMAYDPTVLALRGGTVITFPSQYLGMCNINGNLIQAQPDWTAAFSGQQVSLGITFQNPIIHTAGFSAYEYVYLLNINENIIHDAYNGIFVNHYAAPRGFHTYTNENTIYERQNGTGLPMRTQYGINHTSCFNSFVYYNGITKGHLAGASTTGTDSMRAFYAASNTGMDMGCNAESCMGRGYEFFLTNAGTNWHGNTMDSNLKGFVLNAAAIGTQDNGGTPTSSNSINDYWYGTWSSAMQTYVYHGADAINSILYVTSGTTTKPVYNYADHFLRNYIFDTSIFIATRLATACLAIGSPAYDTSNIYNLIAEQHVNYVYNVVSSNWMGQYSLWKSYVLDSTVIDSSAVVAEFVHLADSVSRFKYITDIEYALSTGDVATANSLLGLNIDSMANTAFDPTTQVSMADDTTADNIVENYQNFYRLYIKYVTATMDSTDTLAILALAQLCPERSGAVVFQARALYSDIYNDLSMFNDDSCLDADTTYIASRQANSHHINQVRDSTTAIQQYSLHPNPSDGNITLQQLVPDAQPVKAEIWNAIGMNIYKDELYFTGGFDKLHVFNATPGVYLLRLTDSKNRQFIIKFVIE